MSNSLTTQTVTTSAVVTGYTTIHPDISTSQEVIRSISTTSDENNNLTPINPGSGSLSASVPTEVTTSIQTTSGFFSNTIVSTKSSPSINPTQTTTESKSSSVLFTPTSSANNNGTPASESQQVTTPAQTNTPASEPQQTTTLGQTNTPNIPMVMVSSSSVPSTGTVNIQFEGKASKLASAPLILALLAFL